MPDNMLIVQGGGPTAVFNASLAAVIRERQAQVPHGRIYGARFGMQGLAQGDLIDLSGLSNEALVQMRDTPGAALGSSRFAPSEADLDASVRLLKDRGVHQVVFLGGNGTMSGALKFSDFCESRNVSMQVMGSPKTIDNDLAATDRCPGYGSAARFVAQSTLDLAADLSSLHQPVSIFETLGRDVGWLSAAASLARQDDDDAPHVVCVPEVPFNLDRFLDVISNTVTKIGWALAVVSEGISYADGTPVFQQVLPSGGRTPVRPLIGGVAQHLSGLVAQHLGLRCRSEKPGLIGRSASSAVSPQDLSDAELTGRECVRALMRGESRKMVSLLPFGCPADTVHLVPLAEAAAPRKALPATWLQEGPIAVNAAFRAYAEPLAGELRRAVNPSR